MRSRAVWKWFFLPLLVGGCGAKPAPDEYRESDNRIIKREAKSADNYLQVVTFVELQDGTWQQPKRFYYQGHFTWIGVRNVEKPGRLFSIVTASKPKPIFLPADDKIKDYLFLIRSGAKSADKKVKVDWSEWHLFRVTKQEAERVETLMIPAHSTLKMETEKEEELCRQLVADYEAAYAKAVKKMNEPIKHDTKVPWYAW